MRLPQDVVEWTCFIAWIILLLPVVAFLNTTWVIRRNALFGRLNKDSLEHYYEQFFSEKLKKRRKGRKQGNDEPVAVEARFKRDFGVLYGRRHYILPIGLLGLVSAIGMSMTATSLQAWLHIGRPATSFPAIAVSAFLGAYAWVLYDQFARFRRGDFTPHDVFSHLYRFLIAIPLAISLAAFLIPQMKTGVAFLLAAFPTTALFTLSRRLTSQKFGLGELDREGTSELEKLQSVGRSNAERYQDEGINTIAELAWADPIDLTIKTNRDFSFVIDSISQALLWVYFEDRVKKLYPFSLRGAQEVCSFLDDLDSDESKIKDAAKQGLKDAAALLEMDKESFQYTLLTVRDDPYAQFLFTIWH